jgi:hypothetical protein
LGKGIQKTSWSLRLTGIFEIRLGKARPTFVLPPPRAYRAHQKKGRLAAPLGVEVEGSYNSLFFWMTVGVKKIRSSFFVLIFSWLLKSQPNTGTFISQGIPVSVSCCSVS